MGGEMLILGLSIGVFTLPGPYIGRWILKHTDVNIHSSSSTFLCFAVAYIFFMLVFGLELVHCLNSNHNINVSCRIVNMLVKIPTQVHKNSRVHCDVQNFTS